MTNSELNQYIRHYIEKDRTNRAIMLTAQWGAGKSHYIRNELIPFLQKEENGSHECVVVSLYGLSDLADVSKSLYLESRAKFLKAESEIAAAGKVIAKTVVKSAAGLLHFSIDASKDDLNNLYCSIDLTKKLVIFEDIERVRFDILDFMGYVNSLVEQDGVKVLLVTNEDEIIKYKPVETTEEDRNDHDFFEEPSSKGPHVLTEESQKYLETKEKTIVDTIRFLGDRQCAIHSILSSYFCEDDFSIIDSTCERAVNHLMQAMDNDNLRSLIYACQKTKDILDRIEATFSPDFYQTIFFGITSFSLRYHQGDQMKWTGGNHSSYELGTEHHPLFRFCYDYLLHQQLDLEEVRLSFLEFQELRMYDENKSKYDQDLNVISNWHMNTESDVVAAIESLTEKLRDPSIVSFYEYGRIALHLVRISHVIDYNISEIEGLMIDNLRNKGDAIRSDYVFHYSTMSSDDEEVVAHFEVFQEKMKSALDAREETIFNFTYDPLDIQPFLDRVYKEKAFILEDGAFASRLDNVKIIEMLKKCTAAQLDSFRGIYISMYHSSNIRDFLADDKPSVEGLLDKMKELQAYEGFDKIQKKQIEFFVFNLEDALTRL